MKNHKLLFILPPLVIVILVLKDVVHGRNLARNHDNSLDAPTVQSQSSQLFDNQSPEFQNIENSNSLSSPLENAASRITKKPFGIFVTPKNSPVSPERFLGYHTGLDFEVFPEEKDMDVPVSAVSSGKIVLKEWASGYGGVLVEESEYEGTPVTIVYGHLNLESISKKTGEVLEKGEEIGFLGSGYSHDTDGERKHLHLSIHKGSEINILGYVQNKNQLSGWFDRMIFFE